MIKYILLKSRLLEATSLEKYGNYYCVLIPGPVTDETDTCIGGMVKDNNKNIVMLLTIPKRGSKAAKEEIYVRHVKGKNTKPICFISLDIAKRLQADDPTAFFMIYHELGHVVLGTSRNCKKCRNNSQHKLNGLDKGIVDPDELKADAFAAEYIGIDDSIKSLEESRDAYFLSFQHKILPDKTMPAKAYQEMNLRIEALRNIKTVPPAQ